jgi:hypothetical protein
MPEIIDSITGEVVPGAMETVLVPRKPRPRQEPDQKGLEAARQVAGWHLGYRSWADTLVEAYLNPEEALENLRAEKAED